MPTAFHARRRVWRGRQVLRSNRQQGFRGAQRRAPAFALQRGVHLGRKPLALAGRALRISGLVPAAAWITSIVADLDVS